MNGIITGQIISHYRIAEKLASVGMGEFCTAEEKKLRFSVKPKLLLYELCKYKVTRQSVISGLNRLLNFDYLLITEGGF